MIKLVGVIGVGNMGSKHVECLLGIKELYKVCVYDKNQENLNKCKDNFNVIVFHDVEELIRYVDAIIVSTPSETHFEYLNLALKHNKHILIEKPVFTEEKQYLDFLSSADNTNICIQVNHVEEYRSVFTMLKSYADVVKRIEMVRHTKGVCKCDYDNIILDLLPHDFGLLFSLLNSTNYQIRHILSRNNGSNIMNELELSMVFENGIECFIQEKKECDESTRYIKLYMDDYSVICDFQKNSLILENYKTGLSTINMNDNPLLASIKCFINCVKYKEVPNVGYKKAATVILECLRIKKHILEISEGRNG